MIFTKNCPYCNKSHSITINREDWHKYLTGEHNIHYVFPDLTSQEREFIMTGICKSCWDKYIKYNGEDDPYDDNYDYPEVGVDE